MASSILLALTIIIGLFTISATARPCKTFFVSSYSISINAIPSKNSNPNSEGLSSSSSGYVVLTEISQFNRYIPSHPSEIFINRRIFPAFVHQSQHTQFKQPRRPQLAFPDVFSSFRDRTKDILSVVVALLFGVGCGALTAATMYLVWSLFADRSGYENSFSQFDDSDDGESASPKKIGYVMIPDVAPVDSLPASANKVTA